MLFGLWASLAGYVANTQTLSPVTVDEIQNLDVAQFIDVTLLAFTEAVQLIATIYGQAYGLRLNESLIQDQATSRNPSHQARFLLT